MGEEQDDIQNWKTIIPMKVNRLLRAKFNKNTTNFVSSLTLFSDSPWKRGKKYRVLQQLLEELPSTTVLKSNRRCKILEVETKELQDYVGSPLVFYSFAEGQEHHHLQAVIWRRKALAVSLQLPRTKRETMTRVVNYLETHTSARRMNRADVSTRLVPDEKIIFQINLEKSFCKVSFKVKGVRRRRNEYMKLSFPVQEDYEFLKELTLIKTYNW